jgi:RNA polymerase sigma-70 factor (ECF subfamily)
MTGPPISFEELVERHRTELLAYLIRLLGNVHDAEDICQEALIRAYRAFDPMILNSNARAWLYRIATNLAFNALKQRRRSVAREVPVASSPPFPSFAQALENRERLRRIARAVSDLPPRQRAALMQRQFEGLSYEEIGIALNCNSTTARAHVYQAIKKLRQTLVDEPNR